MKKLKVKMSTDEWNNVAHYTTFEVVENIQEVGDVDGDQEVVSVKKIECIDPEQENDDVYYHDLYEVHTREVDFEQDDIKNKPEEFIDYYAIFREADYYGLNDESEEEEEEER